MLMLTAVVKFPMLVGGAQPAYFIKFSQKEVISMSIGERLYNLRKERGLSQEDLANELGVSRQTVSKWETGESTPDFDKIIPICNFYGITSDELISGKKDIVVANEEDNRKVWARNLAISVGLYIVSIIFIIFFSAVLALPIIGVCLFFATVSVATGIIIYSAIAYSKKKEKLSKEEEKKKTIVKEVCEIVDILGVVAYFLVSFLTGAWYITWVIFLVIGLCEAIVRLIFSIKDNGKDEVKEDE